MLMTAGRIEEAGTLVIHIGKDIACPSKTHLTNTEGRMVVKDMWSAVRQLTGYSNDVRAIEEVGAESLNAHYASISTDLS
jgi:hypothetical protein